MYRIRLDQFEGPLDLLLFFIRRDELDVYDIPISQVTDEFLEYVRLLEEIDLDGVGDFLYMAALLINIKARMLMPTQELDEEGEPIDPRAELVERLLEYVRYKEAAQHLTDQFEYRQNLFTRGHASSEREDIAPDPPSIPQGSIFDLISALRRVLTEAGEEVAHTLESEAYTIEGQQQFLNEQLSTIERVLFTEVARGRSKRFIITTFLAILEMAKDGTVRIELSAGADDFVLRAPTDAETPAVASDVTTRDPAETL